MITFRSMGVGRRHRRGGHRRWRGRGGPGVVYVVPDYIPPEVVVVDDEGDPTAEIDEEGMGAPFEMRHGNLRIVHMGGTDGTGYQMPMQVQIVKAIRIWNTARFTAAGVLPTLRAMRDLAIQNDKWARAFGGAGAAIDSGMVQQAASQLRQLTYLRDLMQKQAGSTYVFGPGHKTWEDVRAAAVAPFTWLGTARANIESGNAAARAAVGEAAQVAIDRTINMPSTIIGGAISYVRDQVEKSLGLPRWLLPVGLVAAGVLILGPVVGQQIGRTRRAATV